jgi:O-antigen chain-terminating methyltransferase
MMPSRLFVMEHASVQPENDGLCLQYTFSPTSPPDSGIVSIPEYWRSLQANFEAQLLNRRFAQMILRNKPEIVVIRGLYGCTLDLPRLADILDVPTCLEILEPIGVEGLDRHTRTALQDALSRVSAFVAKKETRLPTDGIHAPIFETLDEAFGYIEANRSRKESEPDLGYALYEFSSRDHPLLVQMQRQYVKHFKGCTRVLDLGCGAGIFLQLLTEAGISSVGVERDPVVAEYARGMGYDVETSGAIEFLGEQENAFDGIYCSHFIEHLPFHEIKSLLGLLFRALREGGVLLLVFPDPESIRSQLLGFWRDPEHVRFYHPDLIEMLGRACGFDCDWHSHIENPHRVYGFQSEMPPVYLPMRQHEVAGSDPAQPSGKGMASSPWRFGLPQSFNSKGANEDIKALRSQLLAMSEEIHSLRAGMEAMKGCIESLWQMNQTWAWDDNAVLRFRKVAR